MQQLFNIYFVDKGNSIQIGNIYAEEFCTIQEIINMLQIDIKIVKLLIGSPRYSTNGNIENTKIEDQYLQRTIVELNLWHPHDTLDLSICLN